MGPIVWELDGPMPTLKMSNTLSVTGRPLGLLSAAKASQLAPLVLVGPHVGAMAESVSDLHPRHELDAARLTGGGFIITLRCLCRRPAPRGQGLDDAFVRHGAAYEGDGVADSYDVRGLDPLPVDMDLSPGHRLRRNGAGLVQPHKKQPAVDPNYRGVLSGSFVHGARV